MFVHQKGEKFISDCTLLNKGPMFCFFFMYSSYCWKETAHVCQKKLEALVWSSVVHAAHLFLYTSLFSVLSA